MANIENLMDQEVITQVIDPKELENMSVQDLIDKKIITHNIEMFNGEAPVEPEEETPTETTDENVSSEETSEGTETTDENEGTEDEGVENETSKEEETPSESVEDDDAPVIDEETEE